MEYECNGCCVAPEPAPDAQQPSTDTPKITPTSAFTVHETLGRQLHHYGHKARARRLQARRRGGRRVNYTEGDPESDDAAKEADASADLRDDLPAGGSAASRPKRQPKRGRPAKKQCPHRAKLVVSDLPIEAHSRTLKVGVDDCPAMLGWIVYYLHKRSHGSSAANEHERHEHIEVSAPSVARGSKWYRGDAQPSQVQFVSS